MKKRPIALIILDGFGINQRNDGNAIYSANKPNIQKLMEEYPTTKIHTSGMSVGLPEGQMGNSEVGHTNIGAGRIVYQDFTRITKDIEEGTFYKNEEFLKAIENCKKNNSNLHLNGLVSDGGVHSHNTHLYALLKLAKDNNFNRVFINCFLDGRDVPPDSSKDYIEELVSKTKEIGVGEIATIMGRYYAMDRDKRWDRVERAYKAMVYGEGNLKEEPVQAVIDSYNEKVFDEFVIPIVITKNGEPVAKIKQDDSVIFFNFRPDRAREITRALVDVDFDGFERKNNYFNLHYVTMTQYDKTIENVFVAYKPQNLSNTLGEFVSKNGLKQLRIAETEKYAHVTFFFNGGKEAVYEGEDRVLINSPKVATYDLKPEMSAYEVTEEVVKRIESKMYDLIVLNYANPDMVGHTGIMTAAINAIETVDKCIGKVVEAIKKVDGVALITADHGNAEQMLDYDKGGPFTAHTTNDVPLIAVGIENKKLNEGSLCDLAPTIIDIMGYDKPDEMTGVSLIKE